MTNTLGIRNRLMLCLCLLIAMVAEAPAATDVKMPFTLNTRDAAGKPITQNRFYFVYRPDKLPKDKPVPMVIVFECRGGDLPAKFFHRKADEAGFVLVSAAIQGNSTGNAVWINDNPRESGFEDMDYTSEVIARVTKDENCRDVFITGVSKGGHMTCAVACELPRKIKAAADVDEFMGLTTNIPQAPVPMIVYQGTKDINVPYAMVKDTVEAWRANNGLMNAKPVTTYEPSATIPGSVMQTTWDGPNPVAFVTIVGGSHIWPVPGKQTGFDITDSMWAFFAQFVTPDSPSPKIMSEPLDNVQPVGQPASFRVAAVGEGPLAYQWFRNGKKIEGATSSCYTTSPVTQDDNAAQYSVAVTNKAGRATARPATLKVVATAGPTITLNSQDQAVPAGKSAAFQIGAADAKQLKFQWQKNGMDIVGATEASYTMPPAATWDCGATFRCIVSDASGSGASIAATLAVTPSADAPVIVTNPARNRLRPGDKGKFSVVAKSATPMKYQWQKCGMTTNYVDIPGATAETYTSPEVTLQDSRTVFRCVVSNSAGTTASAGEMILVTNNGAATKARSAKPPSD